MNYFTNVQFNIIEKLNSRLNENPELLESLSKRAYSVRSILLSYRQINELNKSNIFIEKREEGKISWRRFTFQEAIYLNVIKKFKEVGFTVGQFQKLKDSFYKFEEFQRAVYLAYAGEKIFITIDSHGNIDYYDQLYYLTSTNKKSDSNIKVSLNLNNLINDFLADKSKGAIEDRIMFCCVIDKIKKELADYPDEMGMTEEETQKLIDKLFKLSDVLWDRWVETLNSKNK